MGAVALWLATDIGRLSMGATLPHINGNAQAIRSPAHIMAGAMTIINIGSGIENGNM